MKTATVSALVLLPLLGSALQGPGPGPKGASSLSGEVWSAAYVSAAASGGHSLAPSSPGLSQRAEGASRAIPVAAQGRRGRRPAAAPRSGTPPKDASPASARASSITAFRRNQVVRIGLTAARDRVTLSCTGPYQVSDPVSGAPAWKESYREGLMIGIRGARPTEGRLYRVQVGTFERKEGAEVLAERLRTETNEPVVVAWVPDRKVWRVRVGEADSREALAAVTARLRELGFADAWINDEPVPQSGASRLVLIDSEYRTHEAPGRTLVVTPIASDALLSIDGRGYRGTFEILLDVSGAIRVVNSVPMESYLRGVVPAELGPLVYPEVEALKAQAVAARTYAYKNLGQFAAEGFDLCDTPRCQVYEGVKVEHPLSDRAVMETEGEIAVFAGEPINALYTSTCGGHTEDAIEIFPEQASAYLVGVPCAPETASRKVRRTVLTGNAALADAPQASAEAATMLAVHGLLPQTLLDPFQLSLPAAPEEANGWIDGLRSACGIVPDAGGGEEPPLAGEGESGPSLGAVAARLVRRLGWSRRLELLVDREEAASWLPDQDQELPAGQAAAVAYFLREKAWPAGLGGLPRPERPATRGELAQLLLYAARSCNLIELEEGIVRGIENGTIRIGTKDGRIARGLGPSPYLFADFGAGPVPVRRVAVVPGDKVRQHLGAGEKIDALLVLPGRQGLSDDRYSNLSSWQVAYTTTELAERLDQYLSSGLLVDVVAVRRGVSGRVTELKVTGTNGQSVIKGFRIRTALGLKENLFTIDRQKEKNGALRRVVFTGRGWGHGVGLCQVGAYGMAVRGQTYAEILTHYYSGIALERLP